MLNFTDTAEKARILKLVKRGKEILQDQDRLVKNWNHILENEEGVRINYRIGLTKQSVKHCRACIMGGIFLAYPESNKYTSHDRTKAADIVATRTSTNIFKKHTVREVQAVYNTAIQQIKDCEEYY